MKSVDITLFVQAISFFIAYYFLRKYVFYPCANILEEQELQEKKLQDLIEIAVVKQDIVHAGMKRRLLEIKQLLLHSIPLTIKQNAYLATKLHALENREPVVLSEGQRNNIKKIISDRIEKVSS